MYYELPDKIKEKLEGYTASDGPRGLSGAGIYKYTSKDNVYFLKIVNVSNRFIDELETEYRILKWLEGKLPAPKVIDFEKTKENYFLLMSDVEGNTLEEIFNKKESKEEIVRIYGESLKLIHNVNIEDCPVKADDKTMLLNAKKYLELGISQENLEVENKNLTPEELYIKLMSLKPKKNENVFIHGDYCLDNIIIKNKRLNGVIDVGRGGIGDKYKDIALAVRSIKRFGEEYLNLFFHTYGITNADWDKIEFYIIMDEFY